MLKVGMQTGYNGWFDYDDPLPGLELIKKHGFDAIDYNIDTFVSTEHLRKESLDSFFDKSEEELYEHFTPLKEALQKTGIVISQMHAPLPAFVYGEDDFNRYMVTVHEKCIAVCDFVGCPAIVVHPTYTANREYRMENNLGFYRTLIPAAKKHGVTVCAENLFTSFNGRHVDGACSHPDECVRLIDALNAEAGEKVFGFCFDMGHANLLGRNIYEFITTLGDRLTLLHIHDNDGANDLHMMPYTYTRNWGRFLVADWEGLIKGLADINFDGTLSFESYNIIRSFPRPLWPQVLALLSATGHYWIDRIEAIRAGEE